MEKRTFQLPWIDRLLLLAIAGLSIQLAVILLEPVIKAWINRPRPGVQSPQRYLVKKGSGSAVVTIPIDYLLYLPPDYTGRKKWPLVVFLHGAGQRGPDLELVRRGGLPGLVTQGQQFNFILLSPQCPPNSGWSPELIVPLIEHISGSLSVDRDRVYLTGYSMGGYGTWSMAIYDPSRFAAIAPLCGGGDVQQAERLMNLPIWAFHGDKDNVVPLEATQRMVDAVKKCRGQVEFTVYAGAGHGIAEMTYQDKQFFKWLLAQRRTPARLADFFERHEYQYGERHQQQSLSYQLFVPRSLTSTKRYPLLVWLYHTESLTADHLSVILKDLGQIGKYRFFILAIPCLSSDSRWFHSLGATDYATADAALAFKIVQKTLRESPVDQDRVYLTGISGGGGRCWRMALSYPELFAAVVPMGAGGGDVSLAARLVNTAIWAFHARDDPTTPSLGDEQMAAAVSSAGGNIHLTLLPSNLHDCRSEVFVTYKVDVMDWMLAQRKGALIWTPPNYSPWQWWHIMLLPCALLVFVRVAWFVEQRQRRASPIAIAAESETTDTEFSIGPLAECEQVGSGAEGFLSGESAEAAPRKQRYRHAE